MTAKHERIPAPSSKPNPAIEARLNTLFDVSPIPEKHLTTLREVELDYLDGRVNQRKLKALENVLLHPLWGEYEIIIDKYLDGDASIKEKVRKADMKRSGLRSLKQFLGVAKVKLSKEDAKLIKLNEEDRTYHEAILEGSRRHITKLKDGTFRVKFARGDVVHDKLYPDFLSARKYRDGFLAQEAAQKESKRIGAPAKKGKALLNKVN